MGTLTSAKAVFTLGVVLFVDQVFGLYFRIDISETNMIQFVRIDPLVVLPSVIGVFLIAIILIGIGVSKWGKKL